MSLNTIKQRTIVEENSFTYRVQITIEETGLPIPVNTITAATMSWETLTGDPINGREDQDILNANDVTITDGQLEWNGKSLDSVIVGTPDAGTLEARVATFQISFGSDSQLNWTETFYIEQVEAIA